MLACRIALAGRVRSAPFAALMLIGALVVVHLVRQIPTTSTRPLFPSSVLVLVEEQAGKSLITATVYYSLLSAAPSALCLFRDMSRALGLEKLCHLDEE